MTCRKLTRVVLTNCALAVLIGLCSVVGAAQTDSDYPSEPAATPVPKATKTPRNSRRKFLDSLVNAGIGSAKKAATKARKPDPVAADPNSSPGAPPDTSGGYTPTPYPADSGTGGYPTSNGDPDPVTGKRDTRVPSGDSGGNTDDAPPAGESGEDAVEPEADTNVAIPAVIDEPAPPSGPSAANWPVPLGIALLVAILGGGAYFFLRRKPKASLADISFRLKRDTKSEQEIKDTDSLTTDFAFTLKFISDRGIQTVEEEPGSA